MNDLEKQIARHEGFRSCAYTCSGGYITVGYGRNLETRGLTKDEALHLMRNDIAICKKELMQNFEFYVELNQARRNVLINMCFNLGISRLKRFARMIKALGDHDYKQASFEMLDSLWAKQVGNRAEELARIMETGEF